MKNQVLFISTSQGFLVNAMIKNIEDAGFSVVTASASSRHSLPSANEFPDIVIVYLEGFIMDCKEVLTFINEEIAIGTENLHVFLIGEPAEIQESLKFINKESVEYIFNRPVNVQDVIQRIEAANAVNSSTRALKKILVVDDDNIALRTMKNWLSKRYEVLMANSGVNAISLLSNTKVDLILLDYEMPVVSGLDVFNMLKHDSSLSDIPVMFLTAKDDRETVMNVLAAKPESYLLKSMKPQDLVMHVNEFFASRHK
ncbi:MAG: response regulator [Treponema sp.]|nr:response regulator [Treponema sp.]